jgi:hypothetical protein
LPHRTRDSNKKLNGVASPFFFGKPFFLEGHRAEISQHRVQPQVIVKRKPTDDLVSFARRDKGASSPP